MYTTQTVYPRNAVRTLIPRKYQNETIRMESRLKKLIPQIQHSRIHPRSDFQFLYCDANAYRQVHGDVNLHRRDRPAIASLTSTEDYHYILIRPHFFQSMLNKPNRQQDDYSFALYVCVNEICLREEMVNPNQLDRHQVAIDTETEISNATISDFLYAPITASSIAESINSLPANRVSYLLGTKLRSCRYAAKYNGYREALIQCLTGTIIIQDSIASAKLKKSQDLINTLTKTQNQLFKALASKIQSSQFPDDVTKRIGNLLKLSCQKELEQYSYHASALLEFI